LHELVPLLDRALATTSRLVGLLRLLNFGDHHLESSGNVGVLSCAGLEPAALQILRQLLSLLYGDLAFAFADVALVANDDDGNGFGTLRMKCQRIFSE
jgi:hypothetical protein